MKRAVLLPALLALFLPAGCSTVQDLTGRGPLRGEAPHIYGGFRTLASGKSVTADMYRNMKSLDLSEVRSGEAAAAMLALYSAPCVLDFSLSTAADTVLLPVTVATYLAR